MLFFVDSSLFCEFKFGHSFLASQHLQSEEDKEGNHQTEETHSFRQGKTENGIGEKLLPDPEPVSELCSVRSSLVTPETHPSSNNFSPMPFSVLPCLKLWVSSV
jgi:hypothetical protein